jgi:hypothetical protein
MPQQDGKKSCGQMSVRAMRARVAAGKVFQNGVMAANDLLLFLLVLKQFETHAMLALPAHGKKLAPRKGRIVHQSVRVMIHPIDAALLDHCAWTKFFCHFSDAFPLVFIGAFYGSMLGGPACRFR